MILVVNCGSSSVKYRLVDLADPTTGGGGLVERIGEPGGDAADHDEALRHVAGDVDRAGRELTAVGHRVVHGGTRFTAPTVIDDDVLAAIRDLSSLAPLHNPANLVGIERAQAWYPGVPHVAVFDTAFHATLPPPAATYALDADLAARLGIRRYGFHGTSHRFVAYRTAALLGRPVTEVNTIVLHLGNGASATAVAGGRSVETSMGLSPLEGLVMGTRPGDIDPAIALHLHREGKLGFDDIDAVLNHRGGLLGLCGESDMRAVLARRDAGDTAATLAIDVYCHRIRKYIGAYHAVLGRLDAIAFTAGVGERSAAIRGQALAGLAPLGISVDPARNGAPATGPRVISADGSPVAVCVVPTDEELAIAEETAALISARRPGPAPA
ncbi:MAG TPA: acetate kinase [Pilimelia sp.]|nr:acetate kinase [Pilimelia sp.]